MEWAKNISRPKICSREELEQFVSIYERFKLMIKLPWCKIEDPMYKKVELATDMRDFWPTLNNMVRELSGQGAMLISWHTSLKSIIMVIFSVEGHVQNAYDPLPRGMISLSPDEWQERDLAELDLDSLAVALCKYFGIKREDFTAEKIRKLEICNQEEYLRLKSIHNALTLLIDHKSKKDESIYLHKQTEVYEDIKDFLPRLNQISRLLNVPLEIGLDGFKIAIFGAKSLSKQEAMLIYSQPKYQDVPMHEALVIEEECLKGIVKENMDDLMQCLRKHFKLTNEDISQEMIERGSEISFPREVKDTNVFKKINDVWTVTFQGCTKYIPDYAGFSYIKLLLSHQGKAFTTTEFLSLYNEKPLAFVNGDKQLDKKAKEDYQKRLEEIDSQLGIVIKNGDIGTQEKLEEEKQVLITELINATGFGNRSKKLSPEFEKYRLSTGQAIVRTMKKIESYIPELAQHLRDAINNPYSGTSLSYHPAKPIDWEL